MTSDLTFFDVLHIFSEKVLIGGFRLPSRSPAYVNCFVSRAGGGGEVTECTPPPVLRVRPNTPAGSGAGLSWANVLLNSNSQFCDIDKDWGRSTSKYKYLDV